MQLGIDNCPRCGKVYAKNPRNLCPACIKEIDQHLEKCIQYLRENRGVTIKELSEATEVPERQIIHFIREGRLSIINNPNIHYGCESCGNPIREGNLCDSCRKRLAKSIQGAMDALKQAHPERFKREDKFFLTQSSSYQKRKDEQ